MFEPVVDFLVCARPSRTWQSYSDRTYGCRAAAKNFLGCTACADASTAKRDVGEDGGSIVGGRCDAALAERTTSRDKPGHRVSHSLHTADWSGIGAALQLPDTLSATPRRRFSPVAEDVETPSRLPRRETAFLDAEIACLFLCGCKRMKNGHHPYMYPHLLIPKH